MKEVIRKIYVADDGANFDNLEECLAYEAERSVNFPHIHLFDCNKQPLDFWDYTSMFFTLIRKDCPDDELKEFIDYVDEEDVRYLTKGTIWTYNGNKDAYIDLGALYHKIENVINIL